MPNKGELRRTLLAHRQAIPMEVRRKWDAAIGTRVLAWWTANPVQRLGVYWPIRNEVDLCSVYAELAARGVQLALPAVTGRHAPLRFLVWAPGDALEKDAFGASVPPASAAAMQPDALLIPCVGFSAARIRLGYGGGFYDRTLAAKPRPRTAGIAYECCRAEFAADIYDVALDEVITEQSPLQCATVAP